MFDVGAFILDFVPLFYFRHPIPEEEEEEEEWAEINIDHLDLDKLDHHLHLDLDLDHLDLPMRYSYPTLRFLPTMYSCDPPHRRRRCKELEE